jgi:hypothetical protein
VTLVCESQRREYRELARFLVQIGQSAFRNPPDIEYLQIEFPESSNREFR